MASTAASRAPTLLATVGLVHGTFLKTVLNVVSLSDYKSNTCLL